MDFRKTIEETAAYKKLNKIQRDMVMKRQNRLAIEHHVEVIKNIGLEQWKKQTMANHINFPIVEEIINNLPAVEPALLN